MSEAKSGPMVPEIGDTMSHAVEPDPISVELRERLKHLRDAASGGAAPAEPDWWQVAYHGGGPAKVSFPRPLYPPDAAKQAKQPSKDAPDCVAYKRTISRLGRWPWQQFDDSFSNGFSHGTSGMVGTTGVAGVQRQQGVEPDSGWIGKQTFTTLRYCLVPIAPGFSHGGEQAMDAVACNLIDEAWQRFQGSPVVPSTVEDAIADFCRNSIGAAGVWHYEQYRPMRYLGVSPNATHNSDCSEHATEAYYWARQQTGVAVPDPNHSGYNGYGYTGTLVDNPQVVAPYKVGDLAIYGPSMSSTSHVVTCYTAGDASSSEWCSHGSEEAPYAVDLHYRSDLLCVVRPGLSP